VSYAIIWSARAQSQLAEIWLNRPDERDEINRAAEDIDRLLSINPQQQGESRDLGRRILFAAPLVAIFRVDEQSRAVRVLNVRETRRREGS
jgi:plasmid stabilization system protein ParE